MSRDNVTLLPFDISERNPGLVEPPTGGDKTFAMLCLAESSMLAVNLFDKGGSYVAIRRSITSLSNGKRKRRVGSTDRPGNSAIEGGSGHVQR